MSVGLKVLLGFTESRGMCLKANWIPCRPWYFRHSYNITKIHLHFFRGNVEHDSYAYSKTQGGEGTPCFTKREPCLLMGPSSAETSVFNSIQVDADIQQGVTLLTEKEMKFQQMKNNIFPTDCYQVLSTQLFKNYLFILFIIYYLFYLLFIYLWEGSEWEANG